MRSDAALAEAVAQAADACLDAVDSDLVRADFGAGEYFFAVEQALVVAAREHHVMPASLIAEVRQWTADLPDNATTTRFRQALDQIRTS